MVLRPRSAQVWALLLLSFGCRPELPVHDPLQITTGDTLPDARLGLDYEFTLLARGGQPPLQWSLGNQPGPLSWLEVDAASGQLHGKASVKVVPSLYLTIRVEDARGDAAQKVVALQAIACQDTEQIACFYAESGQCLQNSVLCANGSFPTCGSGTPSKDPGHCGADSVGCGACGTAGDACDGTCRCGGGPGCGGQTPDCCGGGCVALQTDLANCGSCGHACPASSKAGAHAVCTAGACAEACDGGYTDCSGSCADLQTDLANCGSCGHACPAPSWDNASVACGVGFCTQGCNPGYRYCRDMDNCLPIGACPAPCTVNDPHCPQP